MASSSSAASRGTDRSLAKSVRARWRSFHRRNRNDAVQCISVRELPNAEEVPRTMVVSAEAGPLAASTANGSVAEAPRCGHVNGGQHMSGAACYAAPRPRSYSESRAGACGGSKAMYEVQDSSLMACDQACARCNDVVGGPRSQHSVERDIHEDLDPTCSLPQQQQQQQQQQHSTPTAGTGGEHVPSGKGQRADKENTSSVVGSSQPPRSARARSKSVASYCSSFAKGLANRIGSGRRRPRPSSDSIDITNRPLPDPRQPAVAHSAGAVSTSSTEISSPSSSDSALGSPDCATCPSGAGRSLVVNNNTLFTEQADSLSAGACSHVVVRTRASSSGPSSTVSQHRLSSPPTSVNIPDCSSYRTGAANGSMLVMSTLPVGLSDRPLPLLPASSSSGSATLPIGSAVQSAVAREVSRNVTRHVAAHISNVPSQFADDGGHPSSHRSLDHRHRQQQRRPPPLPARSRSFTVSAGMAPSRRTALPLPPTPPTPPPRNLPESGRRLGNVYDDPEALEQAFGPLRDVGRWYRTVAARHLALRVVQSPPPVLSDNVAAARSARAATMGSAPPVAPRPDFTTVSSPSRSSPNDADAVEHIYERRPASPAHASLLEGLEDLAKHGWYWGPVSRDESAEILADKPDGTFLVRDSTDDRYLLSLTFRSLGRTLHTRIQHFHGSFSFYENPSTSSRCRTVVALVEMALEQSKDGPFCHSNAIGNQQAIPVRLVHPHSRFRTMRSLQQQCRFVIRQTTRYDLICELPLPKMMKTFLMESPFHMG